MPYRVNADLPTRVRKYLPEHAHDIYREAFNHAYAAHAGEFDREKRAHMIAWAAVKRSYVKADDDWVPLNKSDGHFPSTAKLASRSIEPVKRQRIHSSSHELMNHADRMSVRPFPFGDRIEPDTRWVRTRHALKPD